MKTTLVLAFGLILSIPSQAAIYKCVDAKKKVTYADAPCEYEAKPINVVVSEFGGNDNHSYEEKKEAKRQQAILEALEKRGDEEGLMTFKQLDRAELALHNEKKIMDRKNYVTAEERASWAASLKSVRAQKASLVGDGKGSGR